MNNPNEVKEMITVLDLFSGIGGFSLGLEATGGFNTQAFVEINPFSQQILKKHWPEIPCYDDIRSLKGSEGLVDMLCGGFPCQDVSNAGAGKSMSLLGDRSGLWFEYYRLIKEIKPTWVLIENVEALVNKGLSYILFQLSELGYDAEWHIIRACDVGFPHIRSRLWILAYNMRNGMERSSPFPLRRLREVPWGENGRRASNWLYGPGVPSTKFCRSGHGIPNYVDRITAIGNSILPQIAYQWGMAILEAAK